MSPLTRDLLGSLSRQTREVIGMIKQSRKDNEAKLKELTKTIEKPVLQMIGKAFVDETQYEDFVKLIKYNPLTPKGARRERVACLTVGILENIELVGIQEAIKALDPMSYKTQGEAVYNVAKYVRNKDDFINEVFKQYPDLLSPDFNPYLFKTLKLRSLVSYDRDEYNKNGINEAIKTLEGMAKTSEGDAKNWVEVHLNNLSEIREKREERQKETTKAKGSARVL